MAGYFNADLGAPEGHAQGKEIVADLFTVVLEDTSEYLLPRYKPWLREGQMWSMLHGGREVRSCTKYIMGKDHCLLQNVVF